MMFLNRPRHTLLRALLALGGLALLLPLPGQVELGAHFLRGTWAAHATNPALATDGRINVMLPQWYGDAWYSSLNFDAAIGRNRRGDPVLDAASILARLDEENTIRSEMLLGTLGVGLRLGDWWLQLGHQWRDQGYSFYPETLPQLMWEGNGQYLGETLDASTDVEVAARHEWSLGAAWQANANLTLGARLNFLAGTHHFEVERPRLALTTDPDTYALTLDADLLVHTSGDFAYERFDSIELGWRAFNLQPGRALGPNRGLGIDLGATYRRDRWEAALSVLGLGAVRWSGEVENYRVEGIREFSGIDVLDSLFAGASDVGPVLDSLNRLVGVERGEEAYRSQLPTRLYLSLGYRLDERWRLGALFYQEWYRDRRFPAAALGANYRPWPWAEFGALYAYRAGRFDNLGLNANLRAGPLQIVVATDNALGLLTWRQAEALNLRIGLNLVFEAPD